jgi:GDP-4-dehydro-6-deoxy-D-mannose reductase
MSGCAGLGSVAKAAADLALGEMALRGLPVVRLRLFNQIGPGQSEASVVSAFACQIARAEAGLQPPVVNVGALDRWRDFIDVRDGCTAFTAVLRRADMLSPGVAINVASGAPPRRVGEILDPLFVRSLRPCSVDPMPARLRPIDLQRVSGDIARARQLLDRTPVCDWDETPDLILADRRERVGAA